MKKIKNLFTKKNLTALCAGGLLSLAFAPFHLFIIIPISFSVFYFLLEKESDRKEIFWLGFFFGYGHFLVGIYWISISLLVDAAHFAWLIPFALTIIPSILALYLALFAVVYKFLVAKFSFTKIHQKILIFAISWLIFEVLRSNLLSGFPWNLLGYAWMFDVNFAQLASVFGVYGLSFFAVLVGLLPILFWQKKLPLGDKIFSAILLIFLFTNLLFGYHNIDDKKIIHDSKSKLRLVQANIKQEMKWDEQEKMKNFFKHIEMSQAKESSNVKATIWGETSVPYVIDDNPQLLSYLLDAVPSNGVLITGGLRLQRDEKNNSADVWNSIFVLNKNGVSTSYDKHHLVPFGEFVPLHRFLAFLFLDEVVDKITGGGKGFSEGEGAKTLATEDFSFSPLVCYEVIFSRETVSKNHRPDIFVNLTNDAWFGDSSGPYQHFDMARMRAIEYGIPLVRVAGSGISALVDPFGRIVSQIPLNQAAVIDVELIKSNDTTIYATYGHIPLIILVLLAVLFLSISPHKKHASRQNHPN